MVNFSGPGIAEPGRNEYSIPDRGDSMVLYGIRAAWEVTRAGWAGAMIVGEDVPLAVTTVLARPVLELPL